VKLFTFEAVGRRSIGAETRGQVIDLPAAYAAMTAARGLKAGVPQGLPSDMLSFIRLGGAGLDAARDTLAFMAKRPALPVGERAAYHFDEVKLLAPIPRPGKILCTGFHDQGGGEAERDETHSELPTVFAKMPSVVIGPGEAIRHPGSKFQIKCAVILAAIISPKITWPIQAGVMDQIFGYTILSDISAHGPELKESDDTLAKNFDTFCPMGPCIVTTDEIPDLAKLRVSLKVNDKLIQDSSTEEWSCPLPFVFERLSAVMTLEPGDLLGAGMLSGGRSTSSKSLRPGDVCRLEIEGIGVLENPVTGGRVSA
jgi:2-keto-4-pentenoate hydratase/2-oxohepta-3-ene-1,7-dioic acid hydratase in catechol pathway